MNNLFEIISDEKQGQKRCNDEEVLAAVFVCLYYEEQVYEYKKYLQRVPEDIDIYIISTKEDILKIFEEKRYKKITKINRGRDISALLVSAAPYIPKYKYICFIHDKKEKRVSRKEFTDFWKKNLWTNMLGSKEYICNILKDFEEDEKLGMYVPLPPHKGDESAWINPTWGKNYENTKKLASILDLKVEVLEEQPPIALSTVFWARTTALKKLYNKNWDFKDFPDEPIKGDGEINHAVERIFQYVVKDAGYNIKIAMSSSFIDCFLKQLQEELSYLWTSLNQKFGVRYYNDINSYWDKLERIKEFEDKHKKIYIYGAGIRCKDCIKVCGILNIKVAGILVTSKVGEPKKVEGIPVIEIKNFHPDLSKGIIVAVVEKYQQEVIDILEKNNISNYLTF